MLNQGLGSWIHRRRVKSGLKTALIFDGSTISYAQLGERIDRLASALRARGVVPGSRVAYLGENHPAFLETFFAAGTLGAIFVPLNTRLAPPEVRFALRDAGSTILVHADSLSQLAHQGLRRHGGSASHRGAGCVGQDAPRKSPRSRRQHPVS